MATTVTTDDAYRTDNLAMATYLSLNGQSFRLERGQDKAVFIFAPVLDTERDELVKLIATFGSGQARVEPMKFMREVGSVRGQLYDFLDGRRPTRS